MATLALIFLIVIFVGGAAMRNRELEEADKEYGRRVSELEDQYDQTKSEAVRREIDKTYKEWNDEKDYIMDKWDDD